MASDNRPNIKSDLRRRTALTTGRLASTLESDSNATASEVLDELHETLSKRVDAEIDSLARGAVALLNLAEIGGRDSYRVGIEGFEMDARAESMIRATENLLSLSHTLKLLLLLNDEGNEESITRRQELKGGLLAETAAYRADAKQKINDLLLSL